ncbi:Phosphate:Na+ symporter [Beijerinckiaceae bacterium RH AL1]|nr:Na/Pi cotransporter family protein [Beijerinckiaceae bacterium]VVB42569.1 Phosphate:Na+ symporter [Beijerinckiaceae bacterium RH AL8]VVB42572.1 Phosphate:Na+ symporter [Beijerinckiaceae bacterium RH CH11]VVC53382.1 Phosphate:Na+ symporter [Beijerinckiaceae bacterium RH AL1]
MDFDLPATLVELAGSVALLLWGVHMVQTGVQRTFGAKLRRFLATALQNRIKAFAAGAGITALLQSSTATGLMVTGFVADGLVGLVPALAVMLGANVGTTLIVQVLSFNVSGVAPALIFLGVLAFRRATASTRDFGRVLIGLGLMLMALHQFIGYLQPYEDFPSLRLFLGSVSTQPLLDVILAAGLTWAAHSSVAVVLLAMAFAANGTVPPMAAFALVLGANLGTAINPVLEGGVGDDPAARRLPIGNLLNRLLSVGIALALLPKIAPWIVTIDPDNSRSVADFHTVFNLVSAALFLPLLPLYAKFLRKILPVRIAEHDPKAPLYLDASARETPFVALEAATREALRLTDLVENMLLSVKEGLCKPDRRFSGEVKHLEAIVDSLEASIRGYLTSLDTDSMSEADERRMDRILLFVTHVERAADAADRDLLGLIGKMSKKGVTFPADVQASLADLIDRVIMNARASGALLMNADERTARRLVAEKERFRDLEAKATASYFGQLRSGKLQDRTIEALRLDALRHLKRVNTNLIAATAYPVLEESGDLLRSRLRHLDDRDEKA